ncbi:MAG TPA: hypothetical protein PLL20_02100 [Phycisphaerae bacterium]|nr:hypothetical protein [Phycisphaerae bacterium]HRR84034.1 hypothetical protein [Phycisphaerae bacterium]
MSRLIALFVLFMPLFGCVRMSGSASHRASPPVFPGLPLLVDEDFDKPSTQWELDDPRAWKFTRDGDRTVLCLAGNSSYKPPYRSPTGMALLKDVIVSDFVLDARVRSTKADYPHRDMCLFFGYQDAARFYYVHFGLKSDDASNTVHIVNNADRRPIVKTRTDGTPWTEGYHHVRVVRKVAAGTIEVFFDDMTQPCMTAEDKTFTWGRIGVGSFDDAGNVDRVILWGRKVSLPATRTVVP